MRGRFSILLVFVMVLSVVPMATAMANGDGTVSGTVYLDNAVLAGVEVFLADGAGGQYTCTDGNGVFTFTEVNEFFFSATGPAVSEDCSNPKFVDDDGNPLVVAFGVEEDESLNFYVERLPQDHPGFFHQLKRALYNCYDRSGGATADILTDFDSRLDEAWAAGQPKLSEEGVDTYRSYAETLRQFIMPGVCPQY
jgi:hypothetical protein